MRELRDGQIVPAAQPVDAFIRPTAFQQAPGLPRLQVFSSNAPQIRTIGQGSGGNVQGFNQWAQLADALAPFNDALTKTAMTGGQMYASGEYEKGRNDAIKAQILSNQQRLQGGANWSAETRRLEGVDPEAAQMMDRVNPFRQAGRDNQKARMAAEETKTYILQAYRETPGAETWKPGDPRLAEIKVKATQQILTRFGLDQSSAGFQDYVNPQIAQAWDRVSTEQQADHQKWAKQTIPRMTAVEMGQQYAAARAAGVVEWMELDPTTQQPVRRQARLGDQEFNYGVGRMLLQTLNRIQGEVGLRGETTEAMKDAYLQLVEMAGRDGGEGMVELVTIAQGLEVGPPMKNGRRATLGELFAPESYALAKELRKDAFDLQAMAEAQAMKAFSNEAAETLLMAPAGTPEYEAAVQQLRQRALALGVPTDKAFEVIDSLGGRVESIAERGANATDVEELFIAFEAMDPSSFDTRQALDVLRGRIGALPVEMQREYLKRLGGLSASKGKEAQNSKGSVINPILERGIAAALRREYPKTVSEAALRGVKDIQGFMAYGDANLRTAAARLEEGARKHMQARLAEAAQKAGRRLTAAEETATATAAFNEYLNTKDEGLREYLYPGGVSGGPGIQGGKAEPPQGNVRGGGQAPALPPGRAPVKNQVVSSSNLDNVDPQLLKSGTVVLEKPSALQEIERVLLGRPPSAAVQRAARAAGMPVGQWLLRQADGYPGSITPSTRNELLRRSNQGQAAGQKVSSSARPGNPFGGAAGWLANMMFGISPASASQGGGGNEFPFSRGQFPGGLAIRGGGSFERPESVVFERPGPGNQPGVDFWFPSKRFPAVLGGVVKDVGREGGYGNYVVVESTDPLTGRKVDVLYAHFADGSVKLRPGQRVAPGAILGRQGGTGNVRSADGTIASVDFLAPAPRGSKSMTPYAGFDRLRRHVAAQLQSGGSPAPRGGRSMPARGAMTGKATYYTGSGGSDGVLGGKTANGETFTGRQMTAAVQWSLKPKLMNKWLIVEDVGTGRRIRVWANDTGQMGGTTRRPADRLIDLSPVAFTKLFGSTSRGVGNIRVMVDPNQRGRP
jgi:hypothetical protein